MGPFKDENTKQDVSKLLNRFTKVFVRDNDSVNQMSEMNLSNKSKFVFDPAILIRSMYPQLIRKGRDNNVDDDTNPKIIGISLCRYESFKNGDLEWERSRELTLLKMVEMLIENNKVKKLVFFNFNGDKVIGDRNVTDEFIANLQGNVDIEVVDYSPDTFSVLNSISKCDFILGVRLHSAIIAYSLEIPFMLVEYHRKCTEFLNTIKYEKRFIEDDIEGNYDQIIELEPQTQMIKPDVFENVLLTYVDEILND